MMFSKEPFAPFDNIKPLRPPRHLLASVMEKVRAEQECARLHNRMFYAVLGLFGSGALFVVAVVSFVGTFVNSEFFRLLSLLISDGGMVFANWQDFLSYALESLPVFPICITLLTSGLLLTALFYTIQFGRRTLSLIRSVQYK